ncbi:hypothetical protein F4604DRAFT_1922567 [Suillus subluteus]|nr:hypothetical protein F4604DRAFT_1922567 [Suillus subluteus]
MSHDGYPFKPTSSSPYYSWLLPGISWLLPGPPPSWPSSFLALPGPSWSSLASSLVLPPGPSWLLLDLTWTLSGPPWPSSLALLPGPPWPFLEVLLFSLEAGN